MEIICIDRKTFDEFRTRFCELERRLARLCRSCEDMGLKNWMDNQDVCDVLHISKKTLQVYRDKGLLPFTRIKHKMFYKPEDVHNLLESNYHPLKRKP
ncbi:helix-turn-helix domain-containing protein [Phocaeicola barnesiae]